MKRILMLTHEFPPLRSGVGTYAYELAKAAKGIGHDVTVLAPNYGEELSRSDRLTYDFNVARFDGRDFENRNFLSLIRRVRRWSKKSEFDIIHTTDWPHLLGMAFLNKFRRIPFTATLYGTEIRGWKHYTLPKLFFGKSAFQTPARIIIQSEFVRTLLLENYPSVNPERIILAYPGVASHWFNHEASKKNVRQIYRIPEDHRIMLTVSRLESRKGHRVAMNAMNLLPESIRSKLTYVIVGKPRTHEYLLELKELVSRFKLNVIFTGELSQDFLSGFYETASIFCMPGEPHRARVEGFALVYLEAAAHGLPSIASHISAVPEVVLHEKTGLLVPTHDAEALARSIERLINHPELCRQFSENAKAWAQTFTWERCARQTYGP
jgi:glycosyltransferase involved in cell wall biosynthesis